jgi:uncharacterized protein YndB with AHSA1/START domain
MSLPVIIERTLNAPVSRVWKALTNKDDMKRWYFDLAEFRPEVGFKFSFEGGPEGKEPYVHLCEVTEVIPEKKISYSWRYKGYPGSTTVIFDLEAEGGDRTRITLKHEGLETFPAENPDFARHNFVEGWTYFIGESLPAFLEGKK